MASYAQLYSINLYRIAHDSTKWYSTDLYQGRYNSHNQTIFLYTEHQDKILFDHKIIKEIIIDVKTRSSCTGSLFLYGTRIQALADGTRNGSADSTKGVVDSGKYLGKLETPKLSSWNTYTINESNNSTMFNNLVNYILGGGKCFCFYAGSTNEENTSNKIHIESAQITVRYIDGVSDITVSERISDSGDSKIVRVNITSYDSDYNNGVKFRFGSNSAYVYENSSKYVEYECRYAYLNNPNDRTLYFTVETYDKNNNFIGSRDYYHVVTLPDLGRPLIDISATSINDNHSSWTSVFIGGFTKMKITVKAKPSDKNGIAAIKTITLNYDGTIASLNNPPIDQNGWYYYEHTTGVIDGGGTHKVHYTVTDIAGGTIEGDYNVEFITYQPPRIISVESYRSDYNTNPNSSSGQYGSVKVNWSHTNIHSTSVSTDINSSYAECRFNGEGAFTISQKNTPYRLSNNKLNIDAEYRFVITVKDTLGGKAVYEGSLSSSDYILHIRKGGKSMGIGQAAGGVANRLSIGWDVDLRNPLPVSSGGTGVKNAKDFADKVNLYTRIPKTPIIKTGRFSNTVDAGNFTITTPAITFANESYGDINEVFESNNMPIVIACIGGSTPSVYAKYLHVVVTDIQKDSSGNYGGFKYQIINNTPQSSVDAYAAANPDEANPGYADVIVNWIAIGNKVAAKLGSIDNPIAWTGQDVVKGKWYVNNGVVRLAINSGPPGIFTNPDYFDI